MLYAPIRWECIKFYNIVSIFQIYHGGFITRGGTLAGLAFKLQRKEHSKQPDRLYFLTVDGNHPLIRNSGDKDIQIIDIDSSQSSNYAKRNDEGSSNTAYS